ncbi:MAG: hypothetical protein ACTSWL_01365 [Promethearchaeota archaeon]
MTPSNVKPIKIAEGLYPWNYSNDPNLVNIRNYIASVKLKAIKQAERDRLGVIVEILYKNYGIKPIQNYSTRNFIECFWKLNLIKARATKKKHIALSIKHFLDYHYYPYRKKIFNFRFTESNHPWGSKNDPNREEVLSFLDASENNAMKNRDRRILSFCLKFLYNEFGPRPIKEYTAREFKRLFQEIQKKQVNRSEKKRYRTTLKQFLKDIVDLLIAENGKQSRNYSFIFSNDFFEFKDSQRIHHKKNYLTPREILNFLNEIKNKFRYTTDYLLYSIFLSSVRGNGLLNLKVKGIKFEYQCFDTLDKGKQSRYFFPKHLVPELRAYIQQHKLSPEDRVFYQYKKPKQINKRTKEIYNKPWTNHDFRRSIMRLWKRAGMGKGDRNVLSNHAKEETDEYYTAENPWDEPAVMQKLFQEYYAYIFLGGPRPRPIGEKEFI